jgi:hypothetical protein
MLRKVILIAAAVLIIAVLFRPAWFIPKMKLQLPNKYTGWVLLVPAVKNGPSSYSDACKCFIIDKKGLCFIEGDLLLSGDFLPTFTDDAVPDSCVKQAGSIFNAGRGKRKDYKYFKFYVAEPALCGIPDYDPRWDRVRFDQQKHEESLLDSLSQYNLMAVY